MATRNILHRSKLDSFKDYLKAKGWIIQDTKGMYEVLRAINPEVQKRPLIIYDGKSKEHFSIDDRDFGIVRGFINSEGWYGTWIKDTTQIFYGSSAR